MENLTIVGMHVKPDDVVKELNSVPQVVDFVEKEWNSKVTHFKSNINYRSPLIWCKSCQSWKCQLIEHYCTSIVFIFVPLNKIAGSFSFWFQNILLTGDLNCDCSYISPEEFDVLRIRKDMRYHWAIDRCADRTAITTNCVYDRIILVGDQLRRAVSKESAVVYPFDQVFNLTKEEVRRSLNSFSEESVSLEKSLFLVLEIICC